GIFHGAGLLENLLEHEVGIVAALGFFGGKFQAADLHLGGVGAQALHVEAAGGEGGHVIVVEIDNLAGVGDDGVGVAGQKILIFADADDERRAAAGADDLAGVVAADDGNAVSADDLAQGVANGLGERTGLAVGPGLALVMIADQMGQHLGVGGGMKSVAGFEEPFLEAVAILDHAIVDEGDF